MSELDKAKDDLFGGDWSVSNIKLFPGTDRTATAEQIAEEVNRALSRLITGNEDE